MHILSFLHVSTVILVSYISRNPAFSSLTSRESISISDVSNSRNIRPNTSIRLFSVAEYEYE